MSNTDKLLLPFMAQSQAGRDVLINSNYELIDHAIWPTLKSRSTTTPPGSPLDGDAYYVPTGATGVWSGKVGQVALWKDGAWYYYWVQKPGWLAWIQDEGTFVVATAASNLVAPTLGEIEQYISSSVLIGSAVALTSGVVANVTSISLPPGDWDVSGNVLLSAGSTTNTTQVNASINTTSASLGTAPNGGASIYQTMNYTGAAPGGFCVGAMRLPLSVTTTVYLVVYAVFTVSTNSAYGFLGARRRR